MNVVNPLGLTIEGHSTLLVAGVVSLGRLIQEPVYSLATLNRGPAALDNGAAALKRLPPKVLGLPHPLLEVGELRGQARHGPGLVAGEARPEPRFRF
jgi:hypothetical protein